MHAKGMMSMKTVLQIGFVLLLLFSTSKVVGSERVLSDFLQTNPSALLVVSNGKILVSKNKDLPLAVGSAFKLAVLVALNREISKGLMAWDEVMVLEEKHRSLPTGVVQVLPIGTPFTLHSLALLMIAYSDNTATDMLIDRVGRGEIEAVLESPVLTTREFFVLKANENLRIKHDRGISRSDLINDIARAPLPGVPEVMTLWNKAIEWMIPVQKLCDLINEVHHLSVFKVNPGLADRKVWKNIAYKGGGEVGVLNLTTLVEADSGQKTCVSVTWNADTAIQNEQFYSEYSELLKTLEN